MKQIAIIGSGISGLTCALLLSKKHRVTLYEANPYLGGHTHTERLSIHGETFGINTGFIVFNDWTYPNFHTLIDYLKIPKQVSDMSFSVKSEINHLEYNGTNLNALFTQRRNLLNPKFLTMIREILKFNKEAQADLAAGFIQPETTLGQYLQRRNYSAYFSKHYIIPMGSAIWSSNEQGMYDFPLAFFIRFFANHGMLSVDDRPQWYVIQGGSSRYVDAIAQALGDRIRLHCPVTRVRRYPNRVEISSLPYGQEQVETDRFDDVIFACHSDQALAILKDDATPEERDILGAIPYQPNEVVLHTDARVLPKRRRAWASWNYHIKPYPSNKVQVTYCMNKLQNIQSNTTFCLSLNITDDIAPDKIIQTYRYSHPVFSIEGIQAQQQFHRISNHNRTHYCGAYWFNGFHEDGVNSALRVTQTYDVDLSVLSNEVSRGQAA
jgi:predicted NAD/FAD-binding protein